MSRKTNILGYMRDVMRRRHYSICRERSYCKWVKRFVFHFNMMPLDKSVFSGAMSEPGPIFQPFYRLCFCPFYRWL